MSFRKKRFRLITAVHRVSEQYKQKQPGRGGGPHSHHASPEQRMQQSREAFVVELRRPFLLADGYKTIFKAPLIQVCMCIPVSIKSIHPLIFNMHTIKTLVNRHYYSSPPPPSHHLFLPLTPHTKYPLCPPPRSSIVSKLNLSGKRVLTVEGWEKRHFYCSRKTHQ